MNNDIIGLILIVAIFSLISFSAGLFVQEKYFTPQCICKSIQGLWTSNSFDFKGQWVHVRVDNTNITDALNNCEHEVSHEIFSRVCSKNITPCMNIMEKDG